MKVFLVRHAESQINQTPEIISGQANPVPLSDEGITQACKLGVRWVVEGQSFDKVYSSTATRAFDTAKIACKRINTGIEKIKTSDDLCELDQGEWEGKPRVEIYTEEVIQRIKNEKENFRAPGGESQLDVEKRMRHWLDRNIDVTSGESVAVFSHGFAIKMLLKSIMGFKQSQSYRLIIDNTSISKIAFIDGEWRVLEINDHRHL